jgi:hypothetical protein
VALKRIRAGRTAREFPAILEALADGRLHLSGVALLARHLKPHNVNDLLTAATHRTKAEIEQLIAERFPQADVPTIVRAIPVTPTLPSPDSPAGQGTIEPEAPAPVAAGQPEQAIAGRVDATTTPEAVRRSAVELAPGPVAVHPPLPTSRPKVTPLASERFALQVTISKISHDKLRRAQELLSHVLPSGDLEQVLDRALDALIKQLEKHKFGATPKPRQSRQRPTANGRQIPMHVKRAVWERDQGQCTFVGDTGHRCGARKFVEYDHVDPVARGGQATVECIRLRCRSHNQLEAEQALGDGFMHEKRETARRARAMSATPVPPSGSPARA